MSRPCLNPAADPHAAPRFPTPFTNVRPLALAVHLIVFGGAFALAAHVPEALAQSAPQATATRAYDIPAGPLSSALVRFAREAGVSLVGAGNAADGKSSPGLKGNYTVQGGFAALLAGSGLEVFRQADGSYGLRPAPVVDKSGEAVLAPVQVSAQSVRDGTTEGTGSYTTRASSTATKLNLSPRETPQTLTVVTRQKMDDFALTSIDDVLGSASTISTQKRGGDGSFFYSRGFRLQSQYDGIPNPIGIGEDNRGPSPDTAFLDKVEILQGASGLMSGAGEPGGTINLVRKRPTEQFQAHVEAQLGSWNKKRLVGDVSGSLIESGKIRGRAVALVDHSDSFTDHVFNNKEGFYGIVEADVTATTTIGANVMYQKSKFNEHYGVPMGPDGADLGLPRSSFFGQKDGDSTKESTSYTVDLKQQLPSDWVLKAAYTHTDISADNAVNNLDGGPLNVATGDGLELWNFLQQREFKSDVVDIYASGPLNLFGRKHDLVFGATSAEMKDKSRSNGWNLTPLNIYSYDGQIPRLTGSYGAWPIENETTQKGAYVATRLNLSDPLKLILGMRASWYEYKSAGVQKQKEDSVISPYAGIIYDINKYTSVYASYSDIFKPQSNLKFGGGTVDPVVGKNYEMGVKGEFLQGRLNASAALFRLEQTNLATLDQAVSTTACDGGRCYKAEDLVVSKGVDLGLNGELLPGWQTGAGYTYVQSEYGSGSNKGKDYGTYRPKHLFRAYTSYLIPGTDWTVGGNVTAQTKIHSEGTDWYGQSFRIDQGGYAVVGLMAKYQISKQAEIGMTINNLFDRRYYQSIGSSSSFLENFYGAPRNMSAILKYRF